MKIAIISDTHDNVPNLEKALSWIKSQDIFVIIHCGDICAPSILTKVIVPNFSGKIHLVCGNVGDRQLLEEAVKTLENVKFYGDRGEIELEKKKIAFCHKPEEAEKLAETRKYDLVFYGHTHQPWVQIIGKTRLANPGNLAGMFYKATFAIYNSETDKLELKILEKLI